MSHILKLLQKALAMREDAIELGVKLAVKLAGVVITAGIYTVFSTLSTSSDIPVNTDGTCDLSAPRKVTFNTYRSCGDNKTCTTSSAYSLHQTRDEGENMVVHINRVRERERTSSGILSNTMIMDFSYVSGGRTLGAAWSSHDQLLGYKFDNKNGTGDISAFSSAPYGSDKAYERGYKEGLDLIKQIEGRAKCTIPHPAQPGVGGAVPGTW
jgi:hypothetical protein